MMKLVVLSLALASGSATLFTNETSLVTSMWESFKAEYGRDYTGAEEAKRLKIFLENLQIIDERNAKEARAGGSGVHGINKFADVSQDEFKARYLTTVVPENLKDIPKVNGERTRSFLPSLPFFARSLAHTHTPTRISIP